MQTAPTLGRALLDFVSWQPGYSSGAIVYMHQGRLRTGFGYGAYAHMPAGTGQLYLLVMGVAFRMVQLLTGNAISPAEIHIGCAPPPARLAVVPAGLPPIRFNQNQSCVWLDEAALATPLPAHHPERYEQLRRQLESGLGTRGRSTAARLRHLLRPALHSGQHSMTDAAARLGMHPRTLRRRLAEEGQGFDRIRDDVRFVVARELLALTSLPLGDVAETLGYAAPGGFSDAFRRWSGTTPSAWRRAQRASAPSSRFPQ